MLFRNAFPDIHQHIHELVAEGNTSKDIAELLQLSLKTVEAHRAQILERLHLEDVTGLVRFAVRVGLITAES